MSGARLSNGKQKSNACDALVIGGGPAGLAAGIALRRQGLDVVVADALIPPIDKACGEGLMPDSRSELAQLGVRLGGGCEFSGVHFARRGEGCDYFATAEFGHNKGIGIRRVELHQRLVEHAEAIGVRLKWDVHADLRRGTEVTIGGEAYRYRYLVGADGEASRVRSWAGLQAGKLRSSRLGFRRHYRVPPWSTNGGICVEVHWGQFGQAYVTPVAEDEVCVAAITRYRGHNFDSILASIPGLRAKLHRRPVIGRDRGGVTTTRKLRRVTRGNVALVGDASGSADAITGGGLGSAFREALLLGETLGRDAIEGYEAGHSDILQLPQTMAATMLAVDRWPWLCKRMSPILADDPELFNRMVSVHVGEERLTHFAMTEGWKIALRLLKSERRWPIHADARSQVTVASAEFTSQEARAS